MYELNRTHARVAFKDLLGQANHFLITTLVGLNAVRNGTATVEDEFRTSWNPKDVRNSAERSRQFVLDLALVRAVDALDSYMMLARRDPMALPSKEFASAMDETRQTVAGRLRVFQNFLPPLEGHQKLFVKLAIDWRNRRVHSLSDVELTSEEESKLLSFGNILHEVYSGLDVEELITRYRLGESPSFKDAASFIRLAHRVVEHFDAQLLKEIDLEEYLRGLVVRVLAPQRLSKRTALLKHACAKTWGDRDKRVTKSLRVLRMVGVHPTSEIKGRQVPDGLISRITEMSSEQAYEYLNKKPI
jgi:hypothetical protein